MVKATLGRRVHAQAFTLIEVLVVIAIIAVLATLVITRIGAARQRANVSKSLHDLSEGYKAILRLESDTGRWPNGCLPNQTSNPEVALNRPEAGLSERPPVKVIEGTCQWSATDVAEWDGPYLQPKQLMDPWDSPYTFDPDYKYPDSKVGAAVVSPGPDHSYYNADDVFIQVYK